MAGKGFGGLLPPSSSFTDTAFADLVGLAVVVAIVVALLTRGAKLRLVIVPVGGDEGGWEEGWWLPLLLGEGGSSPL